MDTKCLRILVVEDHKDTREVVVLFLTSLGHRVESCPDAGTALSRMSDDDLDVLLTDVRLAGATSWGYLDELSRRGKLPPRVISMSASDEYEERRRSKAHGCAFHLVKPFKVSELRAALQ